MDGIEQRDWFPIKIGELTPKARLIIQELIKRGDWTWYLHPGQQKLWKELQESNSKIHVMNLCRQFGKSHFSVTKAVDTCLQNPGSFVYYGAPTMDMVRNIVMPKIQELISILPDNMIPHKSGTIWKFPNGSQFQVVSVQISGGQRLRGIAADLVILDECREMEYLDNLIQSVIDPMFTTTDGELILVSTPPDSPLHPFTDKYIKQAIQGGYYHHATFKENPLNTPARMEKLLKEEALTENSDKFRREYLADYQCVDRSIKVIQSFDEDKNNEFFETYKGPPYKSRPYVGIDLGQRDFTAAIFGIHDWYHGVFVVLDELLLTAPTTENLIKECVNKEKTVFADYITEERNWIHRRCDNNLSFFTDAMNTYNYNLMLVKKLGTDDAMISRLEESLHMGRIKIHPRCKNLITQLKTGVWNKNRTDYQRSVAGGHLDLMDALKYINLHVLWNEKHYDAIIIKPGQMALPKPDPDTIQWKGFIESQLGATDQRHKPKVPFRW